MCNRDWNEFWDKSELLFRKTFLVANNCWTRNRTLTAAFGFIVRSSSVLFHFYLRNGLCVFRKYIREKISIFCRPFDFLVTISWESWIRLRTLVCAPLRLYMINPFGSFVRILKDIVPDLAAFQGGRTWNKWDRWFLLRRSGGLRRKKKRCGRVERKKPRRPRGEWTS